MRRYQGFTLIEVSIVLVIIGLIVGGILTGRDLIDIAAQRAQISQIEKYNTAVRAFTLKYGYFPGDIPDPYASQFGFQLRGQYTGEGDGNGTLEGVNGNGADLDWGLFQVSGETSVLWVDLSTASLIDGSFSTASPSSRPASDVTGSALSQWFPAAKIGNGNYVYDYSGTSAARNGYGNFWGISAVTANKKIGDLDSNPAMTVNQAHNIDQKIDDGLPESGSVQAIYVNYNIATHVVRADGGGIEGPASGTAAPASGTSCYDNGNNASNPLAYSVEQGGGNGMNCALSLKWQ